MLGAIVRRELQHNRRQGQQYIACSFYAAWLISLLLFFFFSYRASCSDLGPALSNHPNPAGAFVTSFLAAFVLQEFLFVFTVTPTFTAGTISDEKHRGTLAELLTTGVTPAEILAGKLLGQSLRLVELLVLGLPLLGFIGGWARLD